MNIEPLKPEHISEVNKLLYAVFPYDYDVHQTFEQGTEYFRTPNFGTLFWRCWVLMFEGKVIGITGLYQVRKNKECWLGWYCLNKKYRGKGIGKLLLKWTLKRAKALGFKKIKLYTSDDPDEREAQFLYDRLGLKRYRSVGIKEYTKIYRSKIL